jgi:hypothetical protein
VDETFSNVVGNSEQGGTSLGGTNSKSFGARVITEGLYHGHWVLVQGCEHSARSLVPLGRFFQSSSLVARSHQRFRLVLLTRSDPSFPACLTEISTVIACEAPRTLRDIMNSLLAEEPGFKDVWNKRNDSWHRMVIAAAHMVAFLMARNNYPGGGWKIRNRCLVNI